MDSDRKYRQHGYMDSDRDGGSRDDGPKPQGPRPPIDVTGPRLPRLVQHVAASRCYNCSDGSAAGHRLQRRLPEVQRGAALLQAVLALRALHALPVSEADPGAHCGEGQGQRVQPVHAARDGGARRDIERLTGAGPQASNSGPPAPRNPEDARSAFDRLFKKT